MTLHHLQLFFAKQPVYQSKLDDTTQLADKIASSLSSADKERLKRDLNQLNADLSDKALSAKEAEEQLQDGLDKWQEFTSKVARIEGALEGADERRVFEPAESLVEAKNSSDLCKVC